MGKNKKFRKNLIVSKLSIFSRPKKWAWPSTEACFLQLSKVLFLIYVKPITCDLYSKICLFANKAKLYRRMEPERLKVIQDELKRTQNLLELNTNKCVFMTITNSDQKSNRLHNLTENVIEKVEKKKLLVCGLARSFHRIKVKNANSIIATGNNRPKFIQTGNKARF